MRIVALEEHYTVPTIVSRIDPAAIRRRGFPAPDIVWGQTLKRNELAQLGDARIADMDASGITLQVLSVAGPGADVDATRAHAKSPLAQMRRKLPCWSWTITRFSPRRLRHGPSDRWQCRRRRNRMSLRVLRRAKHRLACRLVQKNNSWSCAVASSIST